MTPKVTPKVTMDRHNPEKIGLIAGSGQFPILFSKAAKSKGYQVFAVAHRSETDRALEQYVDRIEWIHLGQLKRLIKFFNTCRVAEAVMVGGIKKTRIFSDVRPDTKAIKLIKGLRHIHDDGILRSFADILDAEGIKIRASTHLLPGLLAPAGCWTKRKPGRSERADIDVGWEAAKAIGRMDIGQCVVVRRKTVLAVEAIDGTDATILRGGRLSKGKAVVVKVCKPIQDHRFDMPAVGIRTIETMRSVDARVLVVEAGRAVVFDRRAMIALADQAGIAIVALTREEQSG